MTDLSASAHFECSDSICAPRAALDAHMLRAVCPINSELIVIMMHNLISSLHRQTQTHATQDSVGVMCRMKRGIRRKKLVSR